MGYPFYRGLWLGGEPMCPTTMPHVMIAFEVGGYKITQESVCMVAEMTSPPKEFRSKLKIEFVESEAEMKHEPMRESWVGFKPMRIRAFFGGEELGSIAWVVLPHLTECLGSSCMNIWGLGVRKQYRRNGIATALVSRVMARSYALGARFCSVGTQLWNGPAQATYAKVGYKPYCIVVGRTLNLDNQ
jgi:GNAT superfamily N-acetyltransferase